MNVALSFLAKVDLIHDAKSSKMYHRDQTLAPLDPSILDVGCFPQAAVSGHGKWHVKNFTYQDPELTKRA